jgi:enoyl-CoA hydratase/carnithine racemase
MEFQTLKLREDGAVLYVTFDNPPINLMTGLMVQELFQLTGYLMGNRALKVVVVDSADPDFFIAHFDLDDLTNTVDDPGKASRYPDINGLQALGLSWQNLPQVTMAKIDGRIRGGGLEFALALDMRFASETSLFCSPEATAGFLATGGGATRVLLAAGPARGMEFLLSARDFSASEAERYNLINRSLPVGELDAYVDDLVVRLTRLNHSVLGMHRAVLDQVTAPFADVVFAGMAAENVGFKQGLDSGIIAQRAALQMRQGQTRDVELDLPATLAAFPPLD